MQQIQSPNQHQSPTKYQKVNGCCFRCNKPGHWVKDCPEPAPNRSPISPSASSSPITTSDPQFRSIHCQCGAGLCNIRVSRSQNNPGRKYYQCPGKLVDSDKPPMYCRYFKWCDQLRDEEKRESRPESFPICECGAGISTLMIEDKGPNAGRSYFACHIKKGDGACNFRQWLDDSPESASIIPENIVPERNIILDEFELSNEGAMQIDALEMSACELPIKEVQVQMDARELPLEEVQVQMEEGEGDEACDGAGANCMVSTEINPPPLMNNVSENTPLEEVQVQMEEGEGDEASDEACENRMVSTEINPPSLVNNVSENPSDSKLTDENCITLQKRMNDTAVENVQASVTAAVATLGNPLSEDVLLKYLEAYILKEPGWMGRIVYPSQRVSISALNSFFSGSKPNFDPVIEDASVPSVILEEDSSKEGSSPHLNEPLVLLKGSRDEGSIMKGTILEAFEKLAHGLENDLITLLESMGPQYHKAMLEEANSTFAALERLQVDYGLFRLRVTEYITQAAAVAHIEQTINDDASSRDVLKRYKIEKSRFDEISRAYNEAREAFVASGERLYLLRENASCLRDMLIELETEVSCCEAENAVHKDCLLRISNSMSECNNSLQAASREAAEALMVSEKREIERSAAKAAFEKARAHLRM